MNKSSFVHARITPRLKREAEYVLHQLGITPSELINMVYTNIAQRRTIPFKLKIPNRETLRTLNEVDRGKGLHRAKDIDDLFKQLGI